MAKRPKTLWVGPYLYRVRWDHDACAAAEANGLHEAGLMRLTVDDHMDVQVQRRILLHEVMHACVDLTDDEAVKDEESAIRAIEAGLLGVLRSNPNLVEWLTDV